MVTNSLGLTLAASGLSITTLAPTVQFTASPTNGFVPLSVQFNCANVDSGGNLITNWSWNFDDGSTSPAQNPTHVYHTVGSFILDVTVINSLGLTLPASGPSVTVLPRPAIASFSLSRTNLVVQGANGYSGLTYYVLMSTNVALPKSQWTPLATNAWSAIGNFSLTVTNAVNLSVPKRFYILEVP